MNQNYIKPVIVGHSSDDSKDIIDAFLSAGADFFEKKPANLKNFKKLLNKLLIWIHNLKSIFYSIENKLLFLKIEYLLYFLLKFTIKMI